LQQPLATLANKTLALTKPQLLVAPVTVAQGLKLLLFGWVEPNRGCCELPLHKTGKAITPTLKVGESAISLELQRLVERQQPGIESLL